MSYSTIVNVPESYKASDRIGALFLSPLHKAYRQAMLYMEGMDCDTNAGVGSPEIHVLAYIRRFGPCATSEINRVFGYKKSTVTSMLDRLEAKSYITRDVNPEDRRSFLLAIRPEGEALATAAGAVVERFERAVAAQVSEEDMQGFRNVLKAVSDVTQVDVRNRL